MYINASFLPIAAGLFYGNDFWTAPFFGYDIWTAHSHISHTYLARHRLGIGTSNTLH